MTLELPTQKRANAARIETTLAELDGCTQELVSARDLHAKMGVGRAYAHWIQERIRQCELVEGVDFLNVAHKPKGHNLTIGTDCLLSLPVALQLAVMQKPRASAQ